MTTLQEQANKEGVTRQAIWLRTEKGKAYQKAYQKTDKYKAYERARYHKLHPEAKYYSVKT